jgi:hypothetical protein
LLLTFLRGAWIPTLAIIVFVCSLGALILQLVNADRRDTEYRRPDAENEAERAGEMMAFLDARKRP